jgi:Zn finger protein HypA/HybF involved in hydrogenase expression
MLCQCGYEGNHLTKDWLALDFVIQFEAKDASNVGYNMKESVQPTKKLYACPKCGTIRIHI